MVSSITRVRHAAGRKIQRIYPFLCAVKPLSLALTFVDRMCKPEVETMPQTGSTNNLATETDIDAISMAVLMFWGQVITGLYANPIRRFLHSEVQIGGQIPEVVTIWRRNIIST